MQHFWATFETRTLHLHGALGGNRGKQGGGELMRLLRHAQFCSNISKSGQPGSAARRCSSWSPSSPGAYLMAREKDGPSNTCSRAAGERKQGAISLKSTFVPAARAPPAGSRPSSEPALPHLLHGYPIVGSHVPQPPEQEQQPAALNEAANDRRDCMFDRLLLRSSSPPTVVKQAEMETQQR